MTLATADNLSPSRDTTMNQPIDARRDSFADLVGSAIDASSLTAAARRWGVAESTMRGWTYGREVSFDTIRVLRLADDERLRLLRMVAAGRFRILPSEETAPATMEPTDLRAAGMRLDRHVNELNTTINESLADGVIDQSEAARINLIKDEIQRDAEQTMPERLLARFRRAVGRGG